MNSLSKETKDVLKNTKIDEFLFGSDLAEKLKTSKAISKSGLEMRTPVAGPSGVRRIASTVSQVPAAPRNPTLNARGLRVRRPPSHERTPPHAGRPRRARRPPAPGTRRRASTSAPGDSDFRPAEKLTHSMRSLPWWRRDYPAVAEPARCTRRLAPADDGLILGKDC
ncbi:hypothetical protein MSG28_003548 [Choristoneura fumiferana]|uniref:Uncharacterized protein n=1 Tax=Choristoneura fumiferana TaxID=7141 RepID=A0ACC0KF81_CHOFU|nr:hypothetical protein MSG28_003548 [Choristoneura fumiferana]